jgi:hypothetical protein
MPRLRLDAAAGREERVIRSLIGSARPAAGALALLLGLTFASPPAVNAGETKAPPTKPSIAATAAATVARMDTRAAVRLTQDTPATTSGSEDSHSFFRSSRGAVVLILAAAGLGYAVYSANHDDVKRSPCREDKPGCKFP